MISTTILASRTIATSFARQFMLPAVIASYVVFVVLFVVIGILAHYFTDWWWIFAVPLGGIVVIFTVIIITAYLILQRLTPATTKRQRRLAKQFVKEAGGYSELVGMSRLFIAYKIIGDVIRKKPRSYLTEVTQKPGELRRIFIDLQNSFK